MTEVQLKAGRALGSRYELQERLGSGAMGAVWSALDRETGEVTAAKVLHQQYSSDIGIVTRFVQERSILLGLRHPHIVQVRDLVVEGNNLAIVMDLVSGTDLRKHLDDEQTLAPQRAVTLMADIVEALAVAHAKGVVHRDVKPDNILLDASTEPSIAKLSDFGVARLAQESQVRMSGLLGTADYMAPETFLANEVGTASDIYAAGITLYELLAGRTPFAGENSAANAFVVARHHASSAPPAIDGLNSNLSRMLDAMLAKDPRTRPSAAEVATDLRRLLPELSGHAALAPVAAPSDWDTVEGSVYPTGVVANPGAVDPNATMMGVPTPKAANLPVAGTAPVVTVGSGVDAPETQLGGRLPSRRALDLPTLPPTAGSAPKERNKKVLLIAGAVAALVVVAGLIFFLPSGKGNSGSSKGATATPIQGQPDKNLNSQIEIDRQITLADGSATVQVTWVNNNRTTLKNASFFEALAPFGGTGSCPTVISMTGNGVQTTQPTDAALASACGLEVNIAAIPAGGSVVSTYTLSTKGVEGDKTQAAAKTLDAVSKGTHQALGALTNSWLYSLQRFDGLIVSVGPTSSGQALPLLVRPKWLDGAGGQSQVVYDWRSPKNSNPLTTALGQNLMLNPSGCGIQKLGTTGGQVGFLKATDSEGPCTVNVSLGGNSFESNSFSVNTKTGGVR